MIPRRVIGSGPFKLPGEDRAWRRAEQKAREMLAAVEASEQRMTDIRIKHPQHPGTLPDYRTMMPMKRWVLLGHQVTVRLPDGTMVLDLVTAIMTEAITYEVPVVITSKGYRVYEDEATYRLFPDQGFETWQKLGGVEASSRWFALLRTGWLEEPGEPDA